ncbi:hypothetical protein RHGRI_019061 [Rhododendron griersonianum]|uniref:PLAC8 family protein n=1 Tax=Rhododendron griersonianum TaxID=479676 RepID=A0AAV6JFY1_9ERIC|nr:hypothetical protein RHGRI_019061 [Rhododendron griersonianum]
MASQAHLDKMAVRRDYRNLWHTDLMSTMRADPGYCCLSAICAPCISYMLRKRALYGDMSSGFPFGQIGTHAAVAICLAVADVEKVNAQNFVFVPRFSFALAILLLLLASCCKMSSTYRPPSVTTALLDSCSASNNWPVYFPLLLALPEWKNFKKLLRYCPVSRIWFIALNYYCGAMQTQHKVEMDKRDGKFGPQPAMAVPPSQQMSRMDQSVPPSIGYPPPPAYGQPYGYPPPQNQGYPPAAYPPPAGAYPPQGYPPAGYPR